MQTAREYLRELIERGNVLQNPQYDLNSIHSAYQLSQMTPSQNDFTAWGRDVKAFCYQYLREHPAYTLVESASQAIDQFKIGTVLNYLERIYNDWKFWDSKSSQFDSSIKQSKALQSSLYDVFISHANADKVNYVDELKQSLDKLRINIFYDKDIIEWGDDWKSIILDGVSKAEFAIIVISENFFGREWTEKELHELLNRQNQNGQKIILPILHNITTEQLRAKYPTVADIQSLDSVKYSCDEIALKFAAQLIKRLKK